MRERRKNNAFLSSHHGKVRTGWRFYRLGIGLALGLRSWLGLRLGLGKSKGKGKGKG